MGRAATLRAWVSRRLERLQIVFRSFRRTARVAAPHPIIHQLALTGVASPVLLAHGRFVLTPLGREQSADPALNSDGRESNSEPACDVTHAAATTWSEPTLPAGHPVAHVLRSG